MPEQAVNRIDPGALLADRAYHELREAILTNRLPPGTALSVPALSRQMDISRSPVREAVQRLIHDGLATHVAHRGAEVARVDIDDLRELYIVRAQLEGLAARLATERLDTSALAELHGILDEHTEVVEQGGNDVKHVELDMLYHRRVHQIAGNPHLSTMLDTVEGRSHLALHALWRSSDASRLAVDEHRRILQAMSAGDPDGAEDAAREHVDRLRVRLSQAMIRTPHTAIPDAADRPA